MRRSERGSVASGVVTTDVQTCYRHGDRRAGVVCQRCDRPICPECMHQASVGFHCPECVRSGRQQVYTARTLRSSAGAPVTTALVALNVAIYVVSSLGTGLREPSLSVQLDFAMIGEGLTRTGLIGVAHGEWYRLVTGGFLHGGLLHIGFNMYVLWILGKQLEPVLGRVAFGAIYFTSLLAGSLGVMIADPRALTVGASGAVFGLFGYAVVAQWSRGINPLQTGLGAIILLNLLFTFLVPGISIGGHLGGLVGGFVAGLAHDGVRRRLGAPEWAAVGVVLAIGAACTVGSLAVGASLA